MKKTVHLLVASCFIAALFVPLFSWNFIEAPDAVLVYTLKQLSYAHAPGLVVSQMENMALYWLAIGLAAIHLVLAYGRFAELILRKLQNASILLASALLFSLSVTGYRAEKTILMEIARRIPEPGALFLVLAWIGSAWLFYTNRKANRLG